VVLCFNLKPMGSRAAPHYLHILDKEHPKK